MYSGTRLSRVLWALLVAGVVLALDLVQRFEVPAPAQALTTGDPGIDVSRLQRVAQGDIPMPEGAKAAHASSLLVMPPTQAAALTVFWFSGERESGPLVQIVASQLDRRTHIWSEPRVVANRHVLGAKLGYGLRRLGNPVAWLDAQERMHLFVVATGLGGWAASRILHLQQSSAQQTMESAAFEPVDVLPLSWLWNTSHLVRNAPLPLADGGMVLPVHFELGLKYPVVLRMGAQGRFMGMQRVSTRTHLLQPTLLAQSPQQWLALMRDERPHGKVGAAVTRDSGRHWQDLPDLALDNPDAAVGGMALASGQLLLVHNSSLGSRARLDLSHSRDGQHWSLLATLADGAPTDEFSYPALAWADGSLWISYTVDRKRLAWQQFAPFGDVAQKNMRGKTP
ncbi:MAG: exo-alpha-sialidase [Burkholderiales bacterium]|nr:exo-alpha-sialidase [Burkholderiales bacterium]